MSVGERRRWGGFEGRPFSSRGPSAWLSEGRIRVVSTPSDSPTIRSDRCAAGVSAMSRGFESRPIRSTALWKTQRFPRSEAFSGHSARTDLIARFQTLAQVSPGCGVTERRCARLRRRCCAWRDVPARDYRSVSSVAQRTHSASAAHKKEARHTPVRMVWIDCQRRSSVASFAGSSRRASSGSARFARSKYHR